jgi:hypothetical protein
MMDTEKDNEDVESGLDTSIYNPLRENAGKYLENGYGVIYLAESLLMVKEIKQKL